MLVEFTFAYLEDMGEPESREAIRKALVETPTRFNIPRRALAAAIAAGA